MNQSCQGCMKWGGLALIGLVVVGVGIIGLLVMLGTTDAARELEATTEAERAESERSTSSAAVVRLGSEHTNAAGFAFAPPAEWQVIEQNDSDNKIGFVQLLPPNTTTESADIQFFLFISPVAPLAQELPGGDVSLEAIATYTANASQQATLPEGIELALGEPYATTIGGEDALAFDMTGVAGGQDARGRIVVALANNEQQYFASVITGPETRWQNGALVDAVLDTVRFPDSTGS